MFDISFGQLLLVLIIGLVVLGPERLPVAIKAITKWINALRRMSASVQLELSKELKLQELQESLNKVEQSSIDVMSPEIKESLADLKRVADSLQKEIESTITPDISDPKKLKNSQHEHQNNE